MPRPVEGGGRYVAGIDGLRALAVIAVIVYHLGFSWAPGGQLGVGVFFTLSGYLITDILCRQWESRGRVALKSFWLHRARRLLPALAVMLSVVTVWILLFDRGLWGSVKGNLLAAAFYVSNWYLILHKFNYFARFGPASPLQHLWSLAVEEQFYLIWPWLLLLGLHFIRSKAKLIASVLGLAALSALLMAVLYHPSFNLTRIYEGTDTRAFGLLIGAALAIWLPSTRQQVARRAIQIFDWLGVLGLLVIGMLIWKTNEFQHFLYPVGMLLLSLATALCLAAVTTRGSVLNRVVGMRPLKWVGVRSYGIYLWHYPIIVLTSPRIQSSGVDLGRSILQVGAAVILAALSWRFVEEPIRRGVLNLGWIKNLTRSFPSEESRYANFMRRYGWGVSISTLLCLAACSAMPAFSSNRSTQKGPVLSPFPVVEMPNLDSFPGLQGILPPPVLSSCTSVAHIGDSTSESMVSPEYLPDPQQRLPSQYARVGATRSHMLIVGATSVDEALPGTPNAPQMAKRLLASGYKGCWVLALGTNDTADVYVGSSMNIPARISEMMRLLKGHPVMWVNVVSLLSSGPYSEADMQKWDKSLVQLCPKYPNMKVFDWAAEAKPSWFISDGIHYNSQGSAIRSEAIANALATAFPRPPHKAPPGCVVH